MSLEASIAALTAQAGLLLDLPTQIQAAAQNQIAAIGTEYNNRIASLTRVSYVNQATGNDANSGTVGSPLKTIAAAIAKAPLGGIAQIYLQAAYNVQAAISLSGRIVQIFSDGSQRWPITFERSIAADASINRQLAAFRLSAGSKLMLVGVKLIMPPIDGYTINPDYAANVMFSTVYPGASMDITLLNCDIELPASPFGALVTDQCVTLLTVVSCTLTSQALNGRVVRGVTATGGTASTTIPYLLTNLTTV